jgi:hypothetical protein
LSCDLPDCTPGRALAARNKRTVVIDLRKRAVVATVTGVGNDPYGLAVVDLKGHDPDDD